MGASTLDVRKDSFFSAPVPEESPEQRRRLLLADARIDFGPVQALRHLEHPRAVLYRAALGIRRSVVEPRDPCMGNGARAHRAGLQRHPKLAAFQPLVLQHLRTGANRQHFGMSGRIMQSARTVVRGCNHRPIPDENRAYGHFARRSCPFGFGKRQCHRFGEWPARHGPALDAVEAVCNLTFAG